jgi:hypothetical protein
MSGGLTYGGNFIFLIGKFRRLLPIKLALQWLDDETDLSEVLLVNKEWHNRLRGVVAKKL